MARMKLGIMFSNGSGKLGNVVANKGKGGNVTVREKVTRANPRTTAAQIAVLKVALSLEDGGLGEDAGFEQRAALEGERREGEKGKRL